MADIYSRQLTARGGGSTPLTARGSNHFLAGHGSPSPLGSAASKLLSSRRRHGGSVPQLHSSRHSSASASSARSNMRRQSRTWTDASRTTSTMPRNSVSRSSSLRETVFKSMYGLSPQQVSNGTINPMLPSGFRGAAKRPQSMLPEPSARAAARLTARQNTARAGSAMVKKKERQEKDLELTTRTRDRKMNRDIVRSLRKNQQGIGSRLIAPSTPTEEEKRLEKNKLLMLKESLRQQLNRVNEDLYDYESVLEENEALESKYISLAKELDKLEDSKKTSAREQQFKQPVVSPSLDKDPDILDAMQEANNSNIWSENVGSKFSDQRLAKANESFERVQGCTLGDPYHEEDMKPNSHAFDGQQEIGGGPHEQFLSPVQERAKIVASRYYPAGSSPEASKDDDGIFWPFQGEKVLGERRARRRVAPVAAYVSSLVQGGYGTVLIDGRWTEGQRVDRRIKVPEHQKPSRWVVLNPANDVDSMERAGVVPGTPSGNGYRDWLPVVGAKCIARFPGNKENYLAQIKEITSQGLKVRFLSRGNNKEAIVLPSNVKPVVWNRPLTAQWDRDL